MFFSRKRSQNNMCVVRQVASVSQSPVLFCGSLKYNIEYGLKDCTIDKVQAAAKVANADAFISKLDDGYDTGTDVRTTRIPRVHGKFIDVVLFHCCSNQWEPETKWTICEVDVQRAS